MPSERFPETETKAVKHSEQDDIRRPDRQVATIRDAKSRERSDTADRRRPDSELSHVSREKMRGS